MHDNVQQCADGLRSRLHRLAILLLLTLVEQLCQETVRHVRAAPFLLTNVSRPVSAHHQQPPYSHVTFQLTATYVEGERPLQ